MSARWTRRSALVGLASTAFSGCAGVSLGGGPRVVVIGGGFGGATCARALKQLDPSIDVTLIEPRRRYVACPMSNLVLGGWRTLAQQTVPVAPGLERAGVRLIADRAADVDPAKQTVTLSSGQRVRYDRLVMAPGITLVRSALPGYSGGAAELMPHAWEAGPQTMKLRQQLEAMPDGGTFVIASPDNPYRCPPGPYERASAVAHYFSQAKPRSKILILDAKDRYSKQALFEQAWAERYPGMVEWQGRSDGARVTRVDARQRALYTDFETVRADVANVIPPQRAGLIAQRAGVSDRSGWCPVRAIDFQSTLQPAVHVIGDASIANEMPKSAFSAQAQARLVALQISRYFSGLPSISTKLMNTCFSFVAPDAAVSVADVFAPDGPQWRAVAGAGGTTPLDAAPSMLAAEAQAADRWFDLATAEAWGT